MESNLAFSVYTSPSHSKSAWRIRLWMMECMLTCLAVALLVFIARPLSDGVRPLGLHSRYSIAETEPLRLTPRAPVFLSSPATSLAPLPFFITLNEDSIEKNKRLRAQWLNHYAGSVVAILAICGLIALNLGRRISQIGIKLPLIASCWCIAAYLVGTFNARWEKGSFPDATWEYGAISSLWLIFSGLFLLMALVGFCFLSRRSKKNSFGKCTHSLASVWVYPGFILFCGLGWIWLMDWAARGHVNTQFVGLYQADLLWIALSTLTLIAAHQGYVLSVVSSVACWLDNLRVNGNTLPNGALLLTLLLWIGFVGMSGQTGAENERHSTLLAELMRVPVWLVSGWILYKWVEQGQRSTEALVAMTLLLAVLFAALQFHHSNNAVLAQTMAAVWIFSGLVLTGARKKWGNLIGWLLGVTVAFTGTMLAAWQGLVTSSQHKIGAMSPDFWGVMPWLQNAVPNQGFGIGKTPWCSYEQMAGLAGNCLHSGVPSQVQRDYVAVGLFAEWGWLATLLILGGLLLWLWELVRHSPDARFETLNFGLLRQWIVIGFSATGMVQIIVSVAGLSGNLPLSGMAIPMLSLGGASLIGVALFAGLSVNSTHFKHIRMLKLVTDVNDNVMSSKATNAMQVAGKPL